MLNKITFKFGLEDNNGMYDAWVSPKVWENLSNLRNRMNRKDFRVYDDPIFDDEIYGEENGVGNVVGRKIVVICDNMFNKLVFKEVEDAKKRGIWG